MTMSNKEYYLKQLDAIQDFFLLGAHRAPVVIEQQNVINNSLFNLLPLVPIGRGEIVAGSFASRIFNPNVVANDIDIYFKCKEDAFAWCVRNRIDSPEFSSPINSPMCSWVNRNGRIYNLIVGVPFENAKDLIAGFDIRACAVAYDFNNNTLYHVEGAQEDMLNLHITFQVSARHVTVRRLLKYLKKGFVINNYQQALFAELIKIQPINRDQELLGGY